MKIKNSQPFITGKEIKYIKEIIDNKYQLSGDGIFTKKVQQLLEERYKVRKALLTTSCTTALELAIRLLDLKEGDEVMVPSFTFTSTANAVLVNQGLIVNFVDIDPDTLNIDPLDLEKRITQKSKVVIVVHYAGVSCDMDAIIAIAKKHNLKIIEDAAQGIEGKYKNQALGTIGDFGCISFHDTKNIVAGEGGVLFINTTDSQILSRAEILREKGTNRSKFLKGEVDKYTWVDIGFSSLPGELISAFLLAQLEEVENITNRRLRIFNLYKEKLTSLAKQGLIKLPTIPSYAQPNAHIFYLILKDQITRDIVMASLKEKGIQAIFHYQPLHSSPMGQNLGYQPNDLSVTESLSQRLIRLPLFADMTDQEVSFVVDSLSEALDQSIQQKVSVSVIIPAFNEGGNIKYLLRSIQNQTEDSFSIEKIIVISDGSTDDTIEKVKEVEDSRIKIVEYKERKGKSFHLNTFSTLTNSDVLVLFDADVMLNGKDVISRLIDPIIKEKNVGLVSGNFKPVEIKGFLQQAIESSINVYETLRHEFKGGHNALGCTGRIQALSKPFYQVLTVPHTMVLNDIYTYFVCLDKGFEFRHIKEVEVYYQVPTNIKDYLNQFKRFCVGSCRMNKIFGKLFEKEYAFSKKRMYFLMFKEFIKRPIHCSFIYLVNMVGKHQAKKEQDCMDGKWEFVGSTKTLTNLNEFKYDKPV